MNTKLVIHVGIGIVGYVVWAIMAYADPSQRSGFLTFNISMATGTIGLALRDMQNPEKPASDVAVKQEVKVDPAAAPWKDAPPTASSPLRV